MRELPTKPYLIRAIYEWCVDAGATPYVTVQVDQRSRVPMEYVKDGQIVLNIGSDATRDLTMDNERMQFSARFGGVSREITVAMDAVVAIFAKENGQGLVFPAAEGEDAAPREEAAPTQGDDGSQPPGSGRPRLQVVK
ncbi:MAG: ClpXP protease specificity-enhancing factor [Pseudomonadota bacterium]